VELKDRVEKISALIGDLRQAADNGPKSRKLIDSLFRAVHSFKAAASAEGRHDSSNAAHEFENLLQALRSGELNFDNDRLQVLEEAAAGLLGGTEISFEIQTVRRHALLPAEFSFLRDEERHRALAAIEEGSNLYVMQVMLEVCDFDERFRQLKERLAEVGELISTSPAMEDDKIIFQVVYAAKTEKIRVQTVIRKAALAGKSLAAVLNKHVEFVSQGEEVLLERSVCEALGDVLLHLVRNAVDHGIESRGTVVLEVTQDGDNARIRVTDDGQGIAPENLPKLFQPGFSTATEITDVSGRGVGLDVVATTLDELKGHVSVTSQPQKGSSFEIMIPNPSSDA
jgi:chemotaxis protein histidine kinase CheA